MKTTTIAAGAIAIALTLTACGTSDDPSAGASTRSTSSTSTAAGLKAGDTVDGADLATRMTGAMVKAGSGTMTMDLMTGGKASGSFVVKEGKLEQRMTLPVQGQVMEVVTAGGFVYIKGIPGSEKPWVKIDPKADDPFSTMFGGMLAGIGDPRQGAKAMEGQTATVVTSSEAFTVYDMSIDSTKLLGDTGLAPTPNSLPTVKARFTLDKQDRPLSVVFDVGGQTIRIGYADWGKKITIAEPPASQVGTFEIPKG